MKIALEALDVLGLALANKGHAWTTRERQLYENAVAYLTSGDCEEIGSSASGRYRSEKPRSGPRLQSDPS